MLRIARSLTRNTCAALLAMVVLFAVMMFVPTSAHAHGAHHDATAIGMSDVEQPETAQCHPGHACSVLALEPARMTVSKIGEISETCPLSGQPMLTGWTITFDPPPPRLPA